MLQIVTNKNCLSYFVQFLDTHNALPLIKFWLDADSFRTAAAAELSLPGTPYSEEKHKFRLELNAHHRHPENSQALPKATLSKSVSLDMANFRSSSAAVIGNSFDNFQDDDSVSNSSLYEQCSLPDDEAGSCNGDIPSRCSSGASGISSASNPSGPDGNRLNKPSGDQSIVPDTNNSMTNVSSDMGRPLTDDEKSQLYEQNLQKHQNLMHKDAASPIIPPATIIEDEVLHINDQNDTPVTKAKRTCFQSSLASDAIRIFKKYLTSKSPHHIEMPATILANISLALGAKNDIDIESCKESNEIGQLFVDAQAFVLQSLERDHLNEFIESSFYCKYCVDILTGDSLKMQDVLSCDSALFYFMEFLEQESQRHYLDFWLAAINFRKLLSANDEADDSDVAQAQSDALVLYEKYFSLQATSSLQMSDRIRFAIEENICTTTVALISSCFDDAVAIVERYLDQKYLRPFLTSHLFYKYLSELLHRIDGPATVGLPTNQSTPSKPNRHRKTYSDCTNEKTLQYRQSIPISSQNTLLAMESSSGSGKTKKMRNSTAAAADMQIDSRQMYNPDLLWRRKRPSSIGAGLSFGRVDALGRYERDFDMEPVTAIGHHGADGKAVLATKGNRIRQVVRRLVNLPEDHVQEDIAWQMAEMIVKDITSITLSSSNGNRQAKAPVNGST